MGGDIDRLFNVTLAKRDKDRGGEPIFAQSIETGEVLVDRRAEKWPGLFGEQRAEKEGKPVDSVEEIRKTATREILVSLEEQGLTINEMARRLGIAKWQVSELRARYELTKPGRRYRAAAVVDKEPCEPIPEEPSESIPEEPTRVKAREELEEEKEESCVPEAAVLTCRACGCTDEEACPGGCVWVEDPEGGDLCSTCYDRLYGQGEDSLIGLSITNSGVYEAKMLLKHLSAIVMFIEELQPTDGPFLLSLEIRSLGGIGNV